MKELAADKAKKYQAANDIDTSSFLSSPGSAFAKQGLREITMVEI